MSLHASAPSCQRLRQTIAAAGFFAIRALSLGMTSSASSRIDSFHGPGFSL